MLRRFPLLLIACLFWGDVQAWAGDSQPNFLLLFSDDQSYEAVGYRGMTEVRTPHLDQLASRSTSFTHAYNQGSWSGAVCVASRTMLNTGRFVWHAQEVYRSAEQERAAGRFWSEHLKKAGYDTYMTGKWHVPANPERAFDVTGSVRPGMPQDTKASYNRPLSDSDDAWKPWDPAQKGYWQGGQHWSEVVADEAIGFLKRAGKSKNPFFMYIAFNAPHDPRQSPQSYVEGYPLEEISTPANFLPEYPEKDKMGSPPSLRDEKLAPFPRTTYAVRVHRQEYFAIITHLDEQIGRILDQLNQMPQAEQTYVFFTSDHGLSCGHHGLMGKQNMYDHSVRVPLLVSGPGIEPGTNTAAVYLQDIMPTTLELAGIERPDHVEFHSLLPLLNGDKQTSYNAIYSGYLELQRMISADGFKLIVYPKANVVKMFNLQDDPLEMTNIAQDSNYSEQRKKLEKLLLEWQEKTGDKLELTSVLGQDEARTGTK